MVCLTLLGKMENLLNKKETEKKTVTDAIGIIARNVIRSIGEETVVEETVVEETVAEETVAEEIVVEPELEVIYVSGGSFIAPYYTFYEDKNAINKITDLKLDITKSYKFERIKNVISHPFYISNQGRDKESSETLTIIGNGTYTNGITGSESITLTFSKDFSLTETPLTYYCTAHNVMASTFSLYEPEPEPELIVESTNKDVSSENIRIDIERAITNVLNYYETLRTGGPLYDSIFYFKVPALVES
jgi:hypothetical protein